MGLGIWNEIPVLQTSQCTENDLKIILIAHFFIIYYYNNWTFLLVNYVFQYFDLIFFISNSIKVFFIYL